VVLVAKGVPTIWDEGEWRMRSERSTMRGMSGLDRRGGDEPGTGLGNGDSDSDGD